VLEEIRRVAALEPDRRLTRRMFDSVARIKSSAVERRFGSWSGASRRAGLNDALPVYSDSAIIEDLRRISESSPNEPFTRAFYSNHGQYSDDHIRRKFGGWREALDAAGIGGRYAGPQITERMKSQPGRAKSDEQILDEIRDISTSLARISRQTPKSGRTYCLTDLAAFRQHSDRLASNRPVSDADILKTRYLRTSSKFGRTMVVLRPYPKWTGRHRRLARRPTSAAMGGGERHSGPSSSAPTRK
jgi:hypothetical protein